MSVTEADIEALIQGGQLEAAAMHLDEAARLNRRRFLPRLVEVLDRLEVVVAGVPFRYIPAATVSIGDDVGDDDERPAHLVKTSALWMAQTPVLGKQLGPLFHTTIIAARHDLPSSTEAHRFSRFDQPECAAVAVTQVSAARLSTSLEARFQGAPLVGRLPTEAEWERAARGCLVGAEHPWGDAIADGTRADFGRFGDWVPRPPTMAAPNDYGLFAMAGTVWEWTSSVYQPYPVPGAPPVVILRPETVIRGGSFVDDDIALRAAFRLSANPQAYCFNVGFRPVLVRAETP